MDFAIFRISLDIHTTSSQVILRVKRGETNRKLHITLREGGQPYQIADGCEAIFSTIKPDGFGINNICDIKDNTIIYTFTDQTTPVAGTMDCELILKDGDRTLFSPHFTIIVEEGAFNGDSIISAPEATALNTLIDRAEKATTDAENVVGDIKSYASDNFANAFDRHAEGAFVQVDDISPVEHSVKCRTASKNLWNMSVLKNTKLLTLNADGTVTISASNYACTSENKLREFCPSLRVGDVVTLSISTNGRPLIYLVGANVRIDRGTTITVTETMLNSFVTFYGAYNQDADFAEPHTVNNIQLELGTEATEYTPYVDPSAIKLTRCGKNLIPFPYINNTASKNGGTITAGEDGGIIFSGTPTDYVGLPIYAGKALARKGTITFSNGGDAKGVIGVLYMYDANGNTIATKSTRDNLVLNLDDFPTATDWNITYLRGGNNEAMSGTAYPQIEFGSVRTEYELFNASQTYTPAADGTVEGVTSLYPTMVLLTDTENTVISCDYTRDSNKVVKELYDYINYLTSALPKTTSIKLDKTKWVGSTSPYSQVVSLPGTTPNSQVDLTPSVEQLAIFHEKDLAFVTENEDGTITVFAIGQKPTNDYTIQATITEVNI